jgi:hypothetical protein
MNHLHAAALTIVGAALALPATATAASPTVVTGPAKTVTYSSATLTGSVNPRGSQTDYYFQYGTTSRYGSQTSLTPVGNGTRSVAASAPISGLRPDTKYHFRLVAVGASKVAGADRAFTTPKVPLSVRINASPNPVLFGSPFVVSGALSGTGNGSKEIVLQATPFPYTAPFATIGNPEITNADGTFSFAFAGLIQNAELRVATVGAHPVLSPVITEGVAVNVVLHVRRTRRRGFARMQGTVAPPEVGAVVLIQRVARKGIRTVARTSVRSARGSTSSFSKVVRVRHHEIYRAQVTINDGGHTSNASPPVLIP